MYITVNQIIDVSLNVRAISICQNMLLKTTNQFRDLNFKTIPLYLKSDWNHCTDVWVDSVLIF